VIESHPSSRRNASPVLKACNNDLRLHSKVPLQKNTALLEMISLKEGAIGEEQHETQPIRNEGCTPLKLGAEQLEPVLATWDKHS
jgi:hypothetical protein